MLLNNFIITFIAFVLRSVSLLTDASLLLCCLMPQPIERKRKKFNPLVIPKQLQKSLPFSSKPKDIPARKQPLLEDRRAVVMEPHERKVLANIQKLRLIQHEKVCSLQLEQLRFGFTTRNFCGRRFWSLAH